MKWYSLVIDFPQSVPRYSTVQYSSVLYSTVQYSSVLYSTVQYSTVQYSTVQYIAVQYSTVQYSTVNKEKSTVDYKLIRTRDGAARRRRDGESKSKAVVLFGFP